MGTENIYLVQNAGQYTGDDTPKRSRIPLSNYRSHEPQPAIDPAGDLPNSGIELRSPALQGDSSPSESPGKPNNTGVGSLLLQGIFLTQESNRYLLHGRQLLYQLNYKRSPAF